jgi:hypothetical protein
MALHPRWSSATRWQSLRESLPEIAELCRALCAVGKGVAGYPPPTLKKRNQWGDFVLRAYWLGPTDGEELTEFVGVTIERRLPRMLAVFRRVEQLPLTAREKELACCSRAIRRDRISPTRWVSARAPSSRTCAISMRS